MFRTAASKLAKRGLSRSSTGATRFSFSKNSTSVRLLSSVPDGAYLDNREDDDKKEVAESSSSGMNPLYWIPIGVAASVPILEFEWFDPNAETLLASTFLGFVVVAYTQGGAMIAQSFKDEANDMLKVQNEAEEQVIAKLEETVEYMKLTENIVDDYQAVMDVTDASYSKLNEAGKIKPSHEFKAQMEKILSAIASEEKNVYEKAKVEMMADATVAVTSSFSTSKELKKIALTSAIEKLTGKGSGSDPVPAEFVKFFQAKSDEAKKADDGAESIEARSAMLTKMNALAENDNMYFRFDVATGQPKLI
jgi:hypothetical protein